MRTLASLVSTVALALASLAVGASSAAARGGYVIPAAPPPPTDDPALTALLNVSKGVSEIAARASKAVVMVATSRTMHGREFEQIDPFDYFFGPGGGSRGRGGQGGPGGPGGQEMPEGPQRRVEGLGSGFIIDLNQGYVITNNHVVEDADEIDLKFANGQTYRGKVLGRDKRTDVAVVRVSSKNWDKTGLGTLALADSTKTVAGEFVVALGAPFGLEASISFGVVSATGRGSLSIAEMGDFIQTDAAINPGNSGGPLLNAVGQVIGMNTAIFSSSGAYNGVGFAVPSSLVRTVAAELINEGKVDRGYIGVQLQPLDPEMVADLKLPQGSGGGLVAHVEAESPASKAGILPGDVITAVDGQPVKSENGLVNTIGLMRPGTQVTLTYYRDGKSHDAKLTLGRYPAEGPAVAQKPGGGGEQGGDQFGMTVAPASPALAQKFHFKSQSGIVVTAVAPDSPAARSGLAPGDVLLRANGKKLTKPEDLYAAAEGHGRLLVQIERQGRYHMAILGTAHGEG